MRPLVKSQLCRQCARGRFLPTECRNMEAGRAWRTSLMTWAAVPGNVADFACPLGRPWGWKPEKQAEQTVDRSTVRPRDSSLNSHSVAPMDLTADKPNSRHGNQLSNAIPPNAPALCLSCPDNRACPNTTTCCGGQIEVNITTPCPRERW